MSFATVARVWRTWNLQPWRIEMFAFSTAPELEAKIRDVVGLYLNPPENTVVVGGEGLRGQMDVAGGGGRT